VADKYGFETRKAYLAEPDGWSRPVWAQLAELGLLGLPFEEQYGGYGGGPVETMLVMEAFGRGLALEPYFASVVLGGGLVRSMGSAGQKTDILTAIANGKRLLAFAHIERHSRYDLADVTTTATRGVTRRGYPTQDGLRGAEITFAGAAGEAIGDPEAALPGVEHAVDRGIAALCAEAVGILASMQELTLDYLKTRKQFGRAIGEFQVLQHRSVDMLVGVEQSRSMALFATVMADETNPVERQRAISAAKVQIGRAGRHVGQEAIQLHGGIGMTMEYKVGHYFKRMTMIDKLYGDADQHLTRLAKLGGLFGRAA
jgi:alkylation response protein AidB-like acyl-CoA dehydrogenase